MDMKTLKVGQRVLIESYFDGRREATVKEVTQGFARPKIRTEITAERREGCDVEECPKCGGQLLMCGRVDVPY